MFRRRAKSPEWATTPFESLREVHVVPLRDEVEHDFPGEACLCGPTSELSVMEGCPDWTYVTHYSLDGREADEPASV